MEAKLIVGPAVTVRTASVEVAAIIVAAEPSTSLIKQRYVPASPETNDEKVSVALVSPAKSSNTLVVVFSFCHW